MVKVRIVITLFLVCLISRSAAAAPQAFKIALVVVEKDGQWRDDPNGNQTAAECRRVRIRSREAKTWFKRAKEVGEREWLEKLDRSQCYAIGNLQDDRHRIYKWEIEQSGRSRIIISSKINIYMSGPELRKIH